MESEKTDHRGSLPQRAAAWAVHLLTACGAACCLFALAAAADRQWQRMFVWLAVAVVIDAVDGSLARAARVQQRTPRFDGGLLDMIVDYVGYVLVPAFALGRSNLLPPAMAWGIGGAVCLASAFQFCQSDAKTDDHFFKGFPSYWNIVIFYLFLLDSSPLFNAAIILFLIALVFVPIKYIYPSRTRQWKRITLPLSMLWALSVSLLLLQFPDAHRGLLVASLLFPLYYVAGSLYLTWRTSRRPSLRWWPHS